MYGTRIYIIWRSMKQRCRDKNAPNYKYYGGRGIGLYKEWETFQPFYEWAVVHGYMDGLSIDRIDVNGNYEPNNCRWVEKTQQHYNTRANRYLTYCGETKSIAEWADVFGINHQTVYSRLSRGWEDLAAVTTAVRKRKRRK